MPANRPALSLIVPTRKRPEQLNRFLISVAATARFSDLIEIVLVVDADDELCRTAAFPSLTIRHVVGPPGRTMGELNRAGYAASRGDHVMLLNDDVVVKTRGWDRTVLSCFRRFPDPVALVHVNDTLIRDYLCTFPILSREYCELIGGICPTEYERYRIDDHIYNVFNLLAVLEKIRIVYLPDVVFEHTNYVLTAGGDAEYRPDEKIHEIDSKRFHVAASQGALPQAPPYKWLYVCEPSMYAPQ